MKTLLLCLWLTMPFVSISQSAFLTTWQTTTPNESITIPTTGSGYNYIVDWGDGSTPTSETGNATHTYLSAGIYQVSISGDFPRIYFKNIGTSKDKIKSIDQWGDIAWKSMEYAFYGCTNLIVLASDDPDLSNVYFMAYMFNSCSNFNQDLSSWDVSNVTSMSYIFSSCYSFNQDLSSWDVSRVGDMSGMFNSCYNFNQDLSSWDVSNVYDMSNMFNSCYYFNQDLSSWDVSNVSSMSGMFSSCDRFNQDLGSWDVSNVRYMSDMFLYSTLSSSNYDALLSGWSLLTLKPNVVFYVYNRTYCNAATARGVLTSSPNNWIITDGGQNCSPSDYFKTTWQTTTPNESITIPTTGSGYNYIVDWGDGSTPTSETGDATHTYLSAGIYQVSISGDFPRIFFNNTGTSKDKIKSIDQWGGIKWTSMEYAFFGCTSLIVLASDDPYLSDVTDMSSMFSSCPSFNQDLSSWDVSNVANMSNMFSSCPNFDQDLSSWDVSNVNDMSGMFADCQNFNDDLSAWNVSAVTDMSNMLINTALSSSNYDALLKAWSILTLQANVPLGVSSSYCNAATARGVLTNSPNNWMITDGGQGCSPSDYFKTTWQTTTPNESISIPTTGSGYSYIVDWGDGSTPTSETGDATHTYLSAGIYQVSISGDFPRIFFNNTGTSKDKIKSIDQWGEITWTSFELAFYNCANLEVLASDAPDLRGVTNMASMFAFCPKMNTSIDHWDVSNVTHMGQLFKYCTTFNQDISSWNVSNVTNMDEMFEGIAMASKNYEALLTSWSLLVLQPNVNFNAGNSTYCFAIIAKDILTNSPNNWMITDGGRNCLPSDYFKTTWQTTTPNESITIPTTGSGYNYIVDWGDGSTPTSETGNAIHTYASAGIYQISISGDFPHIDFHGSSDKDKIKSVDQWGGISWATVGYAFYSCANLEVLASDAPDLSGVTDMAFMFAFCPKMNASIDHWDVSNITRMKYTFHSCQNFNQDLSSWNVGNVVDMSNMFNECQNFDGDISTWDVSNVTNMSYMFNSCPNFNQDLSSWDVGSVEDFSLMFAFCSRFNKPLANWNLSNAKSTLAMFGFAVSFNQNLSDWDISNVTDFTAMFYGCSDYNQDMSRWDMSAATTTNNMFFDCTNFNQDLSSWDVKNVTDMTDMFLQANLSSSNYDALLIGWSQLAYLQWNVELNVGNSMYCSAQAARDLLTNSPLNWVITDGGSCNSWNGSTDSEWNTSGNWSDNSVPISTDPVLISATASNFPLISSIESVDYLVIENGASVTVAAGHCFAVLGDTVVNEGDFILESDATDYAQYQGPQVEATYKQTIGEAGWHSIGSPFMDTKLSDIQFTNSGFLQLGALSECNIQRYNPSAYQTSPPSEWNQAWGSWECATALSDDFDGSTGYNLFLDSYFTNGFPVTLSVKGMLRNESKTVTLNQANGGWNLLSNPFASVLDWESVGLNLDLTNTYYVWDAVNQNYATYQLGGAATFGATQYIAPMQSVFVRTSTWGDGTSGSTPDVDVLIDLTKNDRKLECAVVTNNFYKTSSSLKLTSTNTSNSFQDELIINFGNEYVSSFNQEEDAVKFMTSEATVPSIFAVIENNNCVFGAYPAPVGTVENIPMGFKTEVKTPITITANEIPEGIKVYIEDKLGNTFHDLSTPYTFTAKTNFNTGRLVLHIGDQYMKSWQVNAQDEMFVYASNGELVFTQNEDLIDKTVEIYSLSGQQIASFKIDDSYRHEIPNTAMGLYIVTLQADNTLMRQRIAF